MPKSRRKNRSGKHNGQNTFPNQEKLVNLPI